jgi:hypothetical protein
VRCGDITADGHADALFTVASGATAGDANCCPSSFRVQRYRWTGKRFKTVGRAQRLKRAPRRFYRP